MEMLSDENLSRVRSLHEVASRRGQTLAQMAISWVLRDPRVTSALIGASRWTQIEDALGALDNIEFTPDELEQIDRYAVEGDINIWAGSSEHG
jgi:L-glyceraldehyde 3-phosphate reductase